VGRWQKVRGGVAGVGPEEARALVRDGAALLDVRESSEWQAGHAPGARHVPLGQLGGQFDDLPSDRRIVVVCRSGNRSATATARLTQSGFDAVNLDGGMRAWVASGLPVEAAEGGPGVVV
jgi:rhodanese-related sulfurtransferase